MCGDCGSSKIRLKQVPSKVKYYNLDQGLNYQIAMFEIVKAKTRNISKLIKKGVSELDPAAEVILFGSRARGDDHLDSDWDILILLEDRSNIATERKFRNKLYDLTLETGESFSVFVYSKHDWHKRQYITPFYQNVSREGLQI